MSPSPFFVMKIGSPDSWHSRDSSLARLPRSEIGLMTGMVGCAGGIGGFFLAKALGIAKGMTGGFGAGFVFFGLLALLGFLGLAMVKVRWRTTWGAASGARV